MYKVVFDTNIFVSALNWPLGNPRKAYDRWLGGKFSLVVSIEILTELMRILRDEFGWLDEEAYEVYNLIGQEAEVVTPKERIGVIQDDPADNRALECALCSGALSVAMNTY